MDPQFEKFLFSIGTIVIIGIVGYVGYLILLSTPAGKGLNAFMGGVGAVLGAVGAQLSTCADNGIFGKGCYLGYGGIAIGVAYFGGLVLSFFKVGINARIANISALKGQSDATTIGDVIKDGPDLNKVQEDMDARGMSASAQEAALAKINLRVTSKTAKEAIEKQNLSPEELKAKTAQVNQENADMNNALNEGLDDGDIKDSDDVAEEYMPDF